VAVPARVLAVVLGPTCDGLDDTHARHITPKALQRGHTVSWVLHKPFCAACEHAAQAPVLLPPPTLRRCLSPRVDGDVGWIPLPSFAPISGVTIVVG